MGSFFGYSVCINLLGTKRRVGIAPAGTQLANVLIANVLKRGRIIVGPTREGRFGIYLAFSSFVGLRQSGLSSFRACRKGVWRFRLNFLKQRPDRRGLGQCRCPPRLPIGV